MLITVKSPSYSDDVSAARRLTEVALDDVLEQAANYYDVELASFKRRHSRELSRDLAACRARGLTISRLREPALDFGLGIPIVIVASCTAPKRRCRNPLRCDSRWKQFVVSSTTVSDGASD